MKKLLIAALCASAFLGLSVGTAGAGEITGNGTPIAVKARSICAYSGLNDEITPEEPGKIQSWGAIPKSDRDYLRSIGVSPDAECNGHLNPLR